MPGKENRGSRAAFITDPQQLRGNVPDGLLPAHRDKSAASALGAHALHRPGEAVWVVDELLHCRALDAEAALDMRMSLRFHDGPDTVILHGRIHQTCLAADTADGKLRFCHIACSFYRFFSLFYIPCRRLSSDSS